jgi:hypothetical protein
MMEMTMKTLFLTGVGALLLAIEPASAQQFIGGPGAGIGRSQYVGSPALTPRELACIRANYASTFAMERCGREVVARITRGAAVRKRR